MEETTQAETVRKAQAGDDLAFAELVRQFERQVRAFVATRCSPGMDVDEIAQRVFVTAFKRLDDFEAGTNFRAWLFSIAGFEVIAERTRLRRQADYHTRYVPYALDRELERRAEVCDVEQSKLDYLELCLQPLEGKLRQLLEWRYRDEFPLKDIADRTGRSVGAIKKQLFYLRQQLHGCIQRKLAAEAQP